ncbi:MAG: M67 family metallopeptidase [Planctomycetota bacterium]|jgi:proteasome lid subunit RPN8/RPN11
MDGREEQAEPGLLPEEGVRFCTDVVVSPPEARDRPLAGEAREVRPLGDAVRGECPVFVSFEVLKGAVAYARQDTTRELGGFLVGGRFVDPQGEFIWIERFLEGRGMGNLPASARFTPETFGDAWRRIEEAGPHGYAPLLLGWFHTHPGFGAFFSDADRFIHRRFFDLPFLVAMVTDPVKEELLLYRWREGEIRSSGFFLVRSKSAKPI